MGLWDWIILCLVIGMAAGVVIGLIRRKKTGCSGDCASCTHCPHK